MPTQTELDALHAVVPAAQASMATWGVPASVTLAQWALESGWGQSGLAKQCFNFFGVKHSHLISTEQYMKFRTKEFVNGVEEVVSAEFVRYDSPAAGFDAHAKLLATLPRYIRAMRDSADIPAFCSELQLCGYSTSPTYAQGLLTLIRELNLTQYDVLPPHDPAVAKEIAA